MAQPLDELSDRLRRPLRTGADAEAHEQPWRGLAGPALAVALPESTEEVRSIIEWARSHRITLLPQGAVTGLVGASTPPPQGPAPLVVSTEALTSRLDIDRTAAVAVASAGVRLSALNEAAGEFGLELPVDLAADPALGAMVATNTGGSRVLRHGDMSTWLLGAEAVLADEVVSVVGDVRGLRKDNTGPDPTRLLVGSAGAFGIITTVAVALSPVPDQRCTALIGPIEDRAAVHLLDHLRRELGDRLSAFEVMCPSAIAAALDHMGDPPAVEPGEDPSVTVLVEASGPDGIEDALVAAVMAQDATGTASALMVPTDAAWGLRHAITAGLREQGTVRGFDLCVRPSALPELRRRVRALVADHWPNCFVADFGHWGDGGVHCNVVMPDDADADAPGDADAGAGARARADARAGVDGAALAEEVYELVVDGLGASFSAEHGIGPANADWWTRTTDPATRATLAAVKQTVDPLRILGHPSLPF